MMNAQALKQGILAISLVALAGCSTLLFRSGQGSNERPTVKAQNTFKNLPEPLALQHDAASCERCLRQLEPFITILSDSPRSALACYTVSRVYLTHVSSWATLVMDDGGEGPLLQALKTAEKHEPESRKLAAQILLAGGYAYYAERITSWVKDAKYFTAEDGVPRPPFTESEAQRRGKEYLNKAQSLLDSIINNKKQKSFHPLAKYYALSLFKTSIPPKRVAKIQRELSNVSPDFRFIIQVDQLETLRQSYASDSAPWYDSVEKELDLALAYPIDVLPVHENPYPHVVATKAVEMSVHGGDNARAKRALLRILPLLNDVNDYSLNDRMPYYRYEFLKWLAGIYRIERDYNQSHKVIEQALSLARQKHDNQGMHELLRSAQDIAREAQDNDYLQRLMREEEALNREM